MALGLADVEDDLLAKIRAALTVGGAIKVKTVDTLPHDWEVDMLKRFLAMAPAVLVAFSGGPVKTIGDDEVATQWSMIVVTSHAKESQRRRGTGTAMGIGAYEITERLAIALQGATVDEVGSLNLAAIENLSSGGVESQGLAVYALRFELPMSFTYMADETALAPFETFNAFLDTPPFDGEPEYQSWLAGNTDSPPAAQDTVALDQS